MSVAQFVTSKGVVVPAIRGDEMREVDRIAISETGPNLYQMMENAGRSLANRAVGMMGSLEDAPPIVVLAGTGGNGGGGICAARHLANRGVDVTLVLTDESRLGDVPDHQLSTYRATGGRFGGGEQLNGFEPALVIDAIIGYSLSGPPRGAALEMIEWAISADVQTLSLDVPSGLDPTTGESFGAYVTATETMTLALPKTGLDVEAVGSLWLADIGIPLEVYRRAKIDVPDELFGDQWVVSIHGR